MMSPILSNPLEMGNKEVSAQGFGFLKLGEGSAKFIGLPFKLSGHFYE